MPLRLLIQLSWRNLWRQRRRNLMLFTAILVAVAGCVLMSSLIRGYQYDMMDDVVANLSGNLKVLAPGYRSDPSIERAFALSETFVPDIPRDQLVGWTGRIRVPAVILSERETRGIQLVGIDPKDEQTISFLGNVAIQGEALNDRNDSRILLGAALAAQLNTTIGRRVVVITQGADGKNREAGFRVAGLFDADGVGLEKTFVFTGLRPLQKLLDTKAVTELSVRLRDDRFSAAADRSLKEEMDGLDVMTWRELEPQAAAMFQYADVGVLIWFIILMLALAFGLINTLITAVLERVQELGMLRALGMRAGAVMVQVVIESLLIVVFGLVCGIVLGIGLIASLSDGINLSRWSAGVELAGLHDVLVPRFMIGDVVSVSILALLLGLFASAYPAWRAVRIKPLDALRR